MSLTPKFKGVVEGGKLTLNDPRAFSGYLTSLMGNVSIVVKKWQETRSESQNRLYWKYLRQIELDTGNDANYLHELFKQEFIIPEIVEVMGKTISIRSTTKLNKKSFGEYLSKIELETGISIPDITLLDM